MIGLQYILCNVMGALYTSNTTHTLAIYYKFYMSRGEGEGEREREREREGERGGGGRESNTVF